MLPHFTELLTYVSNVTINEYASAINNVFNAVKDSTVGFFPTPFRQSGITSPCFCLKICEMLYPFFFSNYYQGPAMEKLYNVALPALKKMWIQERLPGQCFNALTKLCKTNLVKGQMTMAQAVLKELHDSCRLPDGIDSPFTSFFFFLSDDFFLLLLCVCLCVCARA